MRRIARELSRAGCGRERVLVEARGGFPSVDGAQPARGRAVGVRCGGARLRARARELRSAGSGLFLHRRARADRQPDRPRRRVARRCVLLLFRRPGVPLPGTDRLRRLAAVQARGEPGARAPLRGLAPGGRVRADAVDQLWPCHAALRGTEFPRHGRRHPRRRGRRRARRFVRLPRRDPAAARPVVRRRVALLGRVVAQGHGHDRARRARRGVLEPQLPRRAAGCPGRAREQGSARRVDPRGKEEGRVPADAAHRGAAAGAREERARAEGKAGAAVQAVRLREPAGARTPRRSGSARGELLARGARGDVAPGGAEAARFRGRGRGRRGPSGAGRHPL